MIGSALARAGAVGFFNERANATHPFAELLFAQNVSIAVK
jgi:hypothetical protein